MYALFQSCISRKMITPTNRANTYPNSMQRLSLTAFSDMLYRDLFRHMFIDVYDLRIHNFSLFYSFLQKQECFSLSTWCCRSHLSHKVVIRTQQLLSHGSTASARTNRWFVHENGWEKVFTILTYTKISLK